MTSRKKVTRLQAREYQAMLKTHEKVLAKIERRLSFTENYAGIFIPPKLAAKNKRKYTRLHKAMLTIKEFDYSHFS